MRSSIRIRITPVPGVYRCMYSQVPCMQILIPCYTCFPSMHTVAAKQFAAQAYFPAIFFLTRPVPYLSLISARFHPKPFPLLCLFPTMRLLCLHVFLLGLFHVRPVSYPSQISVQPNVPSLRPILYQASSLLCRMRKTRQLSRQAAGQACILASGFPEKFSSPDKFMKSETGCLKFCVSKLFYAGKKTVIKSFGKPRPLMKLLQWTFFTARKKEKKICRCFSQSKFCANTHGRKLGKGGGNCL